MVWCPYFHSCQDELLLTIAFAPFVCQPRRQPLSLTVKLFWSPISVPFCHSFQVTCHSFQVTEAPTLFLRWAPYTPFSGSLMGPPLFFPRHHVVFLIAFWTWLRCHPSKKPAQTTFHTATKDKFFRLKKVWMNWIESCFHFVAELTWVHSLLSYR